jgi:3-oxoacyl-[acyl-carrier protein] reductase
VFTPIAGRSVIVTGGSRGIGRGIARCFAGAGALVLIVARDEEAAGATVAEIRSAGGHASYLLDDLADPASADRLAAAALDRYGPSTFSAATPASTPRPRCGS